MCMTVWITTDNISTMSKNFNSNYPGSVTRQKNKTINDNLNRLTQIDMRVWARLPLNVKISKRY